MTGFRKVFIDTAPMIYFLDADETFGDMTRRIFESVLSDSGLLITSVITLNEYSVHPYRTNNAAKIAAFHDFVDGCGIPLLPVTESVADEAARIRAHYAGFKGMDSLQLATAVTAGCDAFLTNDKRLRQFEAMTVLTVDEWNLENMA